MRYEYDVCVIGLGPAGLAVSGVASELGLRVVAIEKRSVGGASVAAGCAPIRALLRAAHARHAVAGLSDVGLAATPMPSPVEPFRRIAERLPHIEEKALAALGKVRVIVREGPASFVDPHTVAVGGKRLTAKRVFVCVGSRPATPSIPGLGGLEYLTPETVLSLERVPESLVVIGGGAVGCEIGQAFHRLGSRVSIVHMDGHLLPHGDSDAGRLLEASFAREGIEVHNGRRISEVSSSGSSIAVRTNVGDTLRGERLLVAAGRSFDFADLELRRAGVEFSERGIHVDATLRTTAHHVYAPGDANGTFFLPNAATHQGMLALVNSLAPAPLRRAFRAYAVPRTVFTEPQVAHVGWLERDLKAHDMPYEAIETKVEDDGAAIVEGIPEGSLRVYASPSGRIYGARIVGEGAAEAINEWSLAIQNKLRLSRILFLQHSDPSTSSLSKRAAESWAARRAQDRLLQRLVKFLT